jgi:catechol 2,3-dioxygenase-like lactoylglutathione lyase family enzyme
VPGFKIPALPDKTAMLSYITLGANDLSASERFYSALLGPLGYEKRDDGGAWVYSLPDANSGDGGPGVVYVMPPFDGQPATVGNGSMVAFRTRSHENVRRIHAAAIAAGGTDEGAPGFRAAYSKNFFVAYLRDPVGNKIALFCKEPLSATV